MKYTAPTKGGLSMYIYTIKDNKAVLLGQQSSYDQLIEQETYPAQVDHPNTHAVLSYSETEGIHWEYIPYIPKELRERVYETEKIISYEDDMLTVDEANRKWQEYQAEGNSKANELTTLIANAKAMIRGQYPDAEQSITG